MIKYSHFFLPKDPQKFFIMEILTPIFFICYQLETKINEAMTYNSHLTQEVEKRREEVNSRREGTCLSSNSESIEALKHQIQICTEDFEYERSDREKAQHRISQLEEEMRQIKSERDRFKTRMSQLEVENSKVCLKLENLFLTVDIDKRLNFSKWCN